MDLDKNPDDTENKPAPLEDENDDEKGEDEKGEDEKEKDESAEHKQLRRYKCKNNEIIKVGKWITMDAEYRIEEFIELIEEGTIFRLDNDELILCQR